MDFPDLHIIIGNALVLLFLFGIPCVFAIYRMRKDDSGIREFQEGTDPMDHSLQAAYMLTGKPGKALAGETAVSLLRYTPPKVLVILLSLLLIGGFLVTFYVTTFLAGERLEFNSLFLPFLLFVYMMVIIDQIEKLKKKTGNHKVARRILFFLLYTPFVVLIAYAIVVILPYRVK